MLKKPRYAHSHKPNINPTSELHTLKLLFEMAVVFDGSAPLERMQLSIQICGLADPKTLNKSKRRPNSSRPGK